MKIRLEESVPYLVGLVIQTIATTGGFLEYLWWNDALPTFRNVRSDGFKWHIAAGIVNTGFLLILYASNVTPVVLVAPIIQASPLFVLILSFGFLQHGSTSTDD